MLLPLVLQICITAWGTKHLFVFLDPSPLWFCIILYPHHHPSAVLDLSPIWTSLEMYNTFLPIWIHHQSSAPSTNWITSVHNVFLLTYNSWAFILSCELVYRTPKMTTSIGMKDAPAWLKRACEMLPCHDFKYVIFSASQADSVQLCDSFHTKMLRYVSRSEF